MSVNRALVSICVACLLLLLLGREAWAISPDRMLDQYRSDVWVYKDGLPRSRVFTMAQTPDGYLWLGTGQGLMRFDGVRFARTAFDSQNQDNPSNAAQSGIYSLSVSPTGELWAGTDGHGFGAVRAGRYTRFATGAEDAQWSRNFASCWTHDGLLVAGGHHSTLVGVLSFVWQGRLVKEAVWPNGIPQAVVEDRAGDLWCAINRIGLVQLDRDGNIKRTLNRRDGLPALEFTCLRCDSAGDLWLGTVKDGLCRYHNGVLITYHAPQELPADDITALCPTREGALWVGTSHGLARCYRDSWQIFRSVGGQEAAEIDGLCEDHEGSLWVSTKGGLIRYCDTKPDQKILWIGTDRGLARYEDGRIRLYGTAEGLPTNGSHLLALDRFGTLWQATDEGVVSVRTQDLDAFDRMALQIQTLPPDSTTTTLSLDGSLDAITAPELDQFLSTKLDPGAKILVLDLAKLRFVSSAGLRIFAKAQKLMKSREGKTLFVNLSPQVQRVFEIVKVASSMQIFTSEEELDVYLASIQDQVYEDDAA